MKKESFCHHSIESYLIDRKAHSNRIQELVRLILLEFYEILRWIWLHQIWSARTHNERANVILYSNKRGQSVWLHRHLCALLLPEMIAMIEVNWNRILTYWFDSLRQHSNCHMMYRQECIALHPKCYYFVSNHQVLLHWMVLSHRRIVDIPFIKRE